MRLVIGTEDGLRVARWIRGEREAQVEAAALEGRRVGAVARVGDVLYAAARGAGVFASEDRGERWTKRSEPPGGREVAALCGVARHPSVLFAGTEPAALYASYDGGRSWTEQEPFRELRESEEWRGYGDRHPHVRTLACDPRDEQRMYAGVEVGGAYRTDDGGRSWRPAGAGLYDDVHVLLPDPAAAGRVYAATGGGLYVSSDRGGEWRAHPDPEIGSAYCTALCARSGPGVGGVRLFLATAQGPPGTWGSDGEGARARLYESRDGGESWSPHPLRPVYPSREAFSALVPEPEGHGGMFVGTTAGTVSYGDPEMEGWSRILRGLPGVVGLVVI